MSSAVRRRKFIFSVEIADTRLAEWLLQDRLRDVNDWDGMIAVRVGPESAVMRPWPILKGARDE